MEKLKDALEIAVEKLANARMAWQAMKGQGSSGLPNQQAAVSLNVTSESPAGDKCPYNKCDGSGIYLVKDGRGIETAIFCECRTLLITKSKLKFAEIPDEFKELKISDFNTALYSDSNRKTAETVKKIAIGYVHKFSEMKEMGKGLYLYGEAKGSGKTRMAVSIGNALIRQHNQSVRFITTVNLLNEIKNTFDKPSNDDESFSNLLEAAKTVDVLILDDLGTEKPTSWVNEMFYTILNDRMTSRMITLFTSNCRVEDLQHDSRIINRIGRMAMPVKFPDESVRTMFAQQENEAALKILLGG